MMANTKLYISLSGGLLFGIMWILLKFTPYVQKLDSVLFAYFQTRRTGCGDFWMTGITYAGNWYFVLILSLIICCLYMLRKQWHKAVLILITVLGIDFLVGFFKVLIMRERPFAALAMLYQNMSFPSGHTARAFVLYGLLIYFCRKVLPGKYRKRLVTISGIAVIALIAFSRIYLSAHWTTDVLAGLCLGCGWLFLVIGLYEKFISA